MIDMVRLRRRALFLRRTVPAGGDCRVDGGTWRDSDSDSQFKDLVSLAWLVQHDEPLVPGNEPRPTCGTPDCLVHTDLTVDAKHLQLAAAPSMDMRAVFRRGLKQGLFSSVGTYR